MSSIDAQPHHDPSPTTTRVQRAAARGLDLVLLCAFIAAGRSSHQEGASGFVVTALPFFAALLCGWLLAGGRRAEALVGGAIVWATTVVLGLALRVATGDTAAPGFVVVTTVVLGVAFLGWRLIARLVRTLRVRAGERGGHTSSRSR